MRSPSASRSLASKVVYSRLLQALMPEDGPARIVRIPRLIRGIAAYSTRRPQSLLTRTHGGVNARSGPVQRPAGADAHRSQAVGCSLAKIGHAFGHVATNVLAPVIAGYTADNRANNESKHRYTPLRDQGNCGAIGIAVRASLGPVKCRFALPSSPPPMPPALARQPFRRDVRGIVAHPAGKPPGCAADAVQTLGLRAEQHHVVRQNRDRP